MKQAWVNAQGTLPSIAVAGVKKMNIDLSRIHEGVEVELRAEPTNPYDPNAIQVVAWYGEERSRNGSLLGYIPREWAAVLRASDWTATVTAVVMFEGAASGLRLRLNRRIVDD